MTVAQLVHSPFGRAPQSRQVPFRAVLRAASRRWSRNAALWRAIGSGLGFALIGLAMIVLAIGAAGVAPPAQQQAADPSALAQAMPAQRAEVHRMSGDSFASMMPVP